MMVFTPTKKEEIEKKKEENDEEICLEESIEYKDPENGYD